MSPVDSDIATLSRIVPGDDHQIACHQGPRTLREGCGEPAAKSTRNMVLGEPDTDPGRFVLID